MLLATSVGQGTDWLCLSEIMRGYLICVICTCNSFIQNCSNFAQWLHTVDDVQLLFEQIWWPFKKFHARNFVILVITLARGYLGGGSVTTGFHSTLFKILTVIAHTLKIYKCIHPILDITLLKKKTMWGTILSLHAKKGT